MLKSLVLVLALSTAAFAQPRAEKLHRSLERIASSSPGRVGVAVWHYKSGEKVDLDGDLPFPLASVFKVPLMVELIRQLQDGTKLSLSTQLTVTEREKCVGSGTLKNSPDGTHVSVERLIELMETISDNTATDMLFRRIGLESVDLLCKQLGCQHTEIQLTNRAAWLLSLGECRQLRGMSPTQLVESWKNMSERERLSTARNCESENARLRLSAFQRLEDASGARNSHADDVLIATNMDNVASPNDLARVFQELDPDKGTVLQPRWRKFCLGVLSRQRYNTRIPRGLPAGVRCYHKTGSIAGVVNDAGLVELPDHSLLCVVVLIRDAGSGSDHLIAEITRAAYAAFR